MVKKTVKGYKKKIGKKTVTVKGYKRKIRPRARKVVKVTKNKFVQEVGRNKHGEILYTKLKKIKR